ncbi:AAA family ATPase [Megasphaera paucivorans]|uniref:Chromosome partitioning protein n=1 Tax=Megasphaera paucivorans TaxID=349095 RepID=A0A1G9UDU7_9FIRM|nr:AAA family ATPase [Megasphaera paucivorans]SDM58106.1 chromosome partitioning protein [Megasphaera paucivorans]
MKTFSFINKKGGVGKTTITVNMAYAIAESCDLRVLVIDNDDQGNDSQFFDADPEKSLADILLGKAEIQDVIQPTRYSNIDIVASGAALLDANVAVIKDEEIVQQTILKESLEKVAANYDVCLIDNPPTINASVINALVASDEVIIVTTPDIYGIRGVAQMADYIEAIKEYNPALRFRGCLLNKFSSTPHGFRCIELLGSQFPLFRTRIRYTKDKLEASAEEKKSIFEYSPNCGFARDLVQFFKELLAGE